MKYVYYPGCSLEGTALEYNVSTRAAMSALGAELLDLNDWTCCGASAAEATSYLLSLVLAGRNLALAEKMEADADFLIPCSACYLNLRRVEDHVKRDSTLKTQINEAIEEEGLVYRGGVKVRHLLDVVARDFSAEQILPLIAGSSKQPRSALALSARSESMIGKIKSRSRARLRINIRVPLLVSLLLMGR